MAEIPTVLDDVSQMIRTNYMGFASFTILIWDHVDTFTEEVEYIWYGKKSPIVYLFLVNRYLTPLGFIVNLFAYLSPIWTQEKCSHFIRFEGSMTMIGIEIVALMMLIRIYALYYRKQWVVRCVALLLLVQTVINAWLLTRGEAVVHNASSGVRACTMIFDPKISVLASSSAWLPLLYDTVAMGLTLYRTIPSIRNKHTAHVMRRLLEDGLLYYTVIFTVTLVLTIMIIAAPPGLKNIVAQLELLLTVTMMSRITLNLRKSISKAYANDKIHSNPTYVFPGASRRISVGSGHSIRFAAATYTPTVTNHAGLRPLVGPLGETLSPPQSPINIPPVIIPLANDA